MPKIIDERLGYPLPLALTGSITTVIFICGALTQITVGRLIDRFELPALFVALSVMQPIGLALAATTTGLPMVLGLTLVTAAIYGQVVINDAMIGRYVADEFRNRGLFAALFCRLYDSWPRGPDDRQIAWALAASRGCCLPLAPSARSSSQGRSGPGL